MPGARVPSRPCRGAVVPTTRQVDGPFRFVSEYRLLIFGLLLILMMRFRPEGLVPNERRQLEFHEEDTELVERIEQELEESGVMTEAAP